MYSIETTPGFIIDSRNHGEAGKILSIFTRELGLVRASAQGIRLEKSKLRYHAQDLGLSVFSLVRGKDYWKLTNAQEFPESKSKIQDDNAKELIARLAQILRRLLNGEEKHTELFDQISNFFVFISEYENVKVQDWATLESIIMLRVLHSLGYIGNEQSFTPELISLPITTDLISKWKENRSVLNRHINLALKESQL